MARGSGGGSPLTFRRTWPPRSPEARAAAPAFPSCKILFFSRLGDDVILSKVIFGIIQAITYTSQTKVPLGQWTLFLLLQRTDDEGLKRPRTGRHSDKKPPLWAQTFDFLAQNRAETLKLLKSKIEQIFCERGGSGGRQPPRGVIHPFLSKLHDIVPHLLSRISLD